MIDLSNNNNNNNNFNCSFCLTYRLIKILHYSILHHRLMLLSWFVGGFAYLRDCSTTHVSCYGSLLSPLIIPEAEWKCMQFWYYLGLVPNRGFAFLQVSLVFNKTKLTIWNTNWDKQKAGYWSYVRLPTNSSSTPYQVRKVNK